MKINRIDDNHNDNRLSEEVSSLHLADPCHISTYIRDVPLYLAVRRIIPILRYFLNSSRSLNKILMTGPKADNMVDNLTRNNSIRSKYKVHIEPREIPNM